MAGTFFIFHCFLRYNGFALPCYFLVRMGDHAYPYLLFFRLHFLSKSASDHSCNFGSLWRIEYYHYQRFCLQSRNPDDQNRNHGNIDEPGRDCASGRFRRKNSGCVHFGLTHNRSVFFVHLYPAWDLYVPLCVSSLDERHHCRGTLIPPLFPSRRSVHFYSPGRFPALRCGGAGHGDPLSD